MPRKPRIDAPGLLYHVVARGIERRNIFCDNKDKEFFLETLGELSKETTTLVYAFALIPNHFHLLLRRVNAPISTLMRRLLTKYALNFNKKHKRAGHLFQNRYKAFICQDDPYFLELIRYIHLNPLRANLVDSLEGLSAYPFAGHSFVLGANKNDWFDPDSVLSHFSTILTKAKKAYLEFVAQGISMGKRPDLTGGGLKRSLGLPKHYPKTKIASDDRILGEGSFVEALFAQTNEEIDIQDKRINPQDIIASICSEFDITEAALLGDTKHRKTAEARALAAYRISKQTGFSGSDIARVLFTSRSAVCRMIKKGEITDRKRRDTSS